MEDNKKYQDLITAVGQRVKILRIQKNTKFTQLKLSNKTGFHCNYISDIERGLRNISLDAIWIIANGLGVTIGEFFQVGFENIK